MKSPLFKELTTIEGRIIVVNKKSLIVPPSPTNDLMVTDISYETIDGIKSNDLVKHDFDNLRDWYSS